ncbi:RrF2 family transcriptional regulator [Neobacillus muris]|uniref:RrF2 family transcriptional regulator n=1 Tax=Neobacillus muris TaxID=2941334 RepID=UPI00203EB508|nr:Rrf2 family transcriptional regulator [Neobacillus muris]
MNSDFVIASHSLVLLANLPDHMANSETIAENVCTNPARIRKIMSTLKKHGMVKTKEGIGGGYILSCDPEHTTLSQIYLAVSTGSLKPHWCTGDPERECVISSNTQSVMDEIFSEAERHMQSFLNQITISSVLERIKHCEANE